MINISNREFSYDIWNKMLIEAADSRKDGKEHKNICRVIYPKGVCTLELKTDKEIKNHFKQYGSWDANCGKMRLREVLNITRICSLNNPVELEMKDSIKNSIDLFGSRAEKKYNDGFVGKVKKVVSAFFNLFLSDSVNLFAMNNVNLDLRVVNYGCRYNLPRFIGNDANFARLINTTTFA